MNVLLLGLGLLSFEAIRAEMKVMRTIASPPDYVIAEGPRVSVIVPAYNEQNYIPALLTALRNQTYQNTDVIVVDNLSTDNTVVVAESFGAKIVSQSEYNLSKSRNVGAAASSGEVLVFIDADSIPESKTIENVINSLQDSCGIVYTSQCSSDSHVMSMLRVIGGMVRIPAAGYFIGIGRNTFNELGGFNETCLPQEGCCEGFDLFDRYVATYGRETVGYLNSYTATSTRRYRAQGYGYTLTHNSWFEERDPMRETPSRNMVIQTYDM